MSKVKPPPARNKGGSRKVVRPPAAKIAPPDPTSLLTPNPAPALIEMGDTAAALLEPLARYIDESHRVIFSDGALFALTPAEYCRVAANVFEAERLLSDATELVVNARDRLADKRTPAVEGGGE